MKCNNGYLLIFVTLLFIHASLGSCSLSSDSEEREVAINSLPTSKPVTAVLTTLAVSKNFEYHIQTNGKIKPLYEQLITSEMAGNLLVCNARVGKRVRFGMMMLQLETISMRHRLERAKLGYFNNSKEYESQLLAYENLLKDKTKEQADDIKQKLKISTGLAGAEQDIKEINYELAKSIIRAPFDGIVSDVKVQQGQRLKHGEELFRIYDPNNLLLEVRVLESEISLLKQNMSAEVSPISSSELVYDAVVFEINPYVDENGMVTVYLKVQKLNSKSLLLKGGQFLFPGMNCTAVIKIPLTKVLVVPKESVVIRSEKAVVFTLENSKAKWNYVVTGRDNGKEVEIKEGLAPNDNVIITNNLQLAHGASVSLMNTR